MNEFQSYDKAQARKIMEDVQKVVDAEPIKPRIVVIGHTLHSNGRFSATLVEAALALNMTIEIIDEEHLELLAPDYRKARIIAIDELPIPKAAENSYWRGKKSKGEKKRQRSEWNNRMRGYRR